MDIPKKNSPKSSVPKSNDPAKPAAPTVAPVKVPPMFRKIDWIALLIAFLGVWAVYLWTLAPELTLEDSGELCTASYYAGIPHPPGYPFWAIYSWFWTFILPFGNVAWRVEVGESFAAAMGCGMLALMISRGSSMLIEGIEELKSLPRQWENHICLVSGAVTGLLLGLGSFMWKESDVINRISLFGVPWLLAMILCLMRWMYAPQQRWYLYLAMLIYGWCATIHQSLLLGAPAIEILIALILPRLGRDLFIGNSAIFLGIFGLMQVGNIPALQAMTQIERVIFYIVGISSLVAAGTMIAKSQKFLTEWRSLLLMGGLWILGFMVYLYEPISGMTNPPMEWGYPRTVEGFFHALSRGQYGTEEGTNIFQNPKLVIFQLYYLADGLSESFSWVYLFVGLIPFAFLLKMHKRERNWIIGLACIYFWISVVLVLVMDVTADRQSSDLCKVFFTASHAVFALLIGYGLTILAAYVATHYEKIRGWCFVGGGVALVLAFYCLVDAVGKLYFGPAGRMKISWLPFADWGGWEFLSVGPNGQFGFADLFHWVAQAFAKDQFGLPIFANLILISLPVIFLLALLVYRQRGPVFILLVLFAITPLCSGLDHWYKCEQRNHWFGYWFGHDMFTPPFTDTDGKLSYDNDRRAQLLKDPAQAKLIYPEMARNTILFGGTDPGRFCPTYIIFCESFIPHYCQPKQDQKFDRRDVYIITQNALADGTYLDYLRAQYNRSKQIDPPFFSELSKYIFSLGIHAFRISTGYALDKNLDAQTDPQVKATLAQQENDVDQNIASGTIFWAVNQSLYYTLDVPFTAWGKHVETYRRQRGVYPPKEIYIPSPEDSQNCFQSYTDDVARRQQLGQLRPGEDVSVENGRVQVSGQVAVMEINGLLCKVIFDNNPTNEFYVEESFPLDWMYPYESPFGVIMKINREAQPELTQDVFDRDHKFWSDYSSRLCGNWITYDTTVKQISDFVERTYIQNNYAGFIGNRAFVRDDDAQKAFSKLRSSQAGMYAWRCSPQCPPEYREKTPALQQALIRETDFAFKQSFAFCPYSPEAVFRYVNFLLQLAQTDEAAGQYAQATQRFDDAILVAETCHKLDPYNDQVSGTIEQLKSFKVQSAARMKDIGQLDTMVNTARTNPGDVKNLITLGATYLSMQQTNQGLTLMSQALASPNLTYDEAATIGQFFGQLNQIAGFEAALKKQIALDPNQPDPHFHLAEVQAVTGRTADAIASLKTALDLNQKQLAANPAANNLLKMAQADPNLNNLRGLPEFQKMVLMK